MNRGRGGHNGNSSGRNFRLKCEECQSSGVYCNHCFICGDASHKHRDCPENH